MLYRFRVRYMCTCLKWIPIPYCSILLRFLSFNQLLGDFTANLIIELRTCKFVNTQQVFDRSPPIFDALLFISQRASCAFGHQSDYHRD